jgi:FKBP-type peptidyl-prolyl cis-trans isomerase FkpA
MKNMIAGLIVAALMVGCNAAKNAEPKNEDEKVRYALGFMMGQRFAPFELNDADIDMIAAGIRDASLNKTSKVELAAYQVKVQEFFQERIKKVSEGQKKKGEEALAAFVKDGATKTASGLAYKALTEGTGAMPAATDTVKVHYHGTLLDGTVFDSSVDRGQPAQFPLDRVIKGWTEGLQLVKTGGKIKLMIPPELAYGDQGAPPKIPGGATLVFEVELLEIAKPEAAPAPKKK